ncbi:PREDICTED: uncharacterized protein LOC109586704 [Amphimedon queenslandica]|uniref:Uncharacterized protein n=1 Tax=Amphimedon queenslandica TaxID=400682 RepID=A0AAN0JN72_AMPQE|nr:PREDICTED: uncharacterized protein LOC109586704 [Amphimedon queenslandica]|eukprot:XP_019858470.1 PREDICTED: uncharacterized protein LOC109586704 [Amphimedon queenslandica]
MPGLTGHYMIIKMSKRRREVVWKALKMCKMRTKLSSQLKSSKEEAKRSRKENEENERICDLSDGDDNPPCEHLIQSYMDYNSVVVSKTDSYPHFMPMCGLGSNMGQNNDDHCWLSSDDADKSETVPASAYYIKPNGMELCV